MKIGRLHKAPRDGENSVQELVHKAINQCLLSSVPGFYENPVLYCETEWYE